MRGRVQLVAVVVYLIAASMSAAADQPANSPSATYVFARLSDRYTEAQREAWFQSQAVGQKVSWSIKIVDISKGWWNYDIQGRVGSGREVLCKVDINKANTNLVADLSKGTKINCSGTIKSYVKFVGTVVLIDDAKIE